MTDPKQRVLIDGYNLRLAAGTGIATYGRNLAVSLRELGYAVELLAGSQESPDQPLLRQIAFLDPKPPPRFSRYKLGHIRKLLASRSGIEAYAVPFDGNVVSRPMDPVLRQVDKVWNAPHVFEWGHRHYDAFHRRLRVRMPSPPNVAHWTYPLPITVDGARNIYTVHDLVPLRLPYATLDSKPRFLSLLNMLTEQADHIVTVSETSKRDIVNLLGIADDRVTNTYQCVEIPEEDRSRPQDAVERDLKGIFGLGYRGYFLFFGAIEPKKNIGRLIEAYLGSGVSAPLVLVGKKAWKWEEELQPFGDLIQPLRPGSPCERGVVHVDYVPRRMLVSLIRGAKAVLFPSLYEGFGLPVLEAMLLDTPVLTSTAGSLPEIAGDAALLVDPYDVQAIAEGIRAIDGNAPLRDDLVAKGARQAALFNRVTYNQRLAELYRRLT